jgi:hypothetical protein
MWDPQHLTTLEASTACYGDNFTLFYIVTKASGSTSRAYVTYIFADAGRFDVSSLSAVRVNFQFNMVPLIKQIDMLLKHCAKLIVWTAGALNDRPVIQIKLTSHVLRAQTLTRG